MNINTGDPPSPGLYVAFLPSELSDAQQQILFWDFWRGWYYPPDVRGEVASWIGPIPDMRI